jgi:hypothetical protein
MTLAYYLDDEPNKEVINEYLSCVPTPPYRTGAYGRWILKEGKNDKASIIRSYFGDLRVMENLAILQRRRLYGNKKYETWMSTSPQERESQAIAVREAKGETVVLGLGMGVIAYALAECNPEVTNITVVERDASVIQLMDECLFTPAAERGDEWPLQVTIVQGDALFYKHDKPVDFLYADIWPHLGDSKAIPDMQLIVKNLKPARAYYWGQEQDVIYYGNKLGIKANPAGMVRAFDYLQKEVGCSLASYPDALAYGRLCLRAALTQIANGKWS